MAKYIDKSAVITEINKLKEHFVNKRDDFERGYHSCLNAVSDSLDTIEVKEVDLEKEIDSTYRNYVAFGRQEIANVAKHFFELGLIEQNK